MLAQPNGEVLAVLDRNELADAELDLTGFSADAAIDVLQHVFDYSRHEPPRRLFIFFAAAIPGKSQTLFQPVGKRLVQALREGLITACNPTADDRRVGFVVLLAGD